MELKTHLWHEIRYTYRDAYVEYLIKQNEAEEFLDQENSKEKKEES